MRGKKINYLEIRQRNEDKRTAIIQVIFVSVLLFIMAGLFLYGMAENERIEQIKGTSYIQELNDSRAVRGIK